MFLFFRSQYESFISPMSVKITEKQLKKPKINDEVYKVRVSH